MLSSSGTRFTLDRSAAMQSGVIRRLLEDCCSDCCSDPVPIAGVDDATLERIVKYCVAGTVLTTADMPENQRDLVHVVLAANYLDIPHVLSVACQCIADTIKGKTAEQIREAYGLENCLTRAEEAEVRAQNRWAF